MTAMTHSRIATLATALAVAAGLVVSSVTLPAQGGQAQGRAGGQGQGRGGAAAQQPARDTQAQTATPTGTGIITGVVTTEGAGTPVRRARVTLSGPEVRGGRSTITNDEGQFTFAALPAGRFTITAAKPGYVDLLYGATV